MTGVDLVKAIYLAFELKRGKKNNLPLESEVRVVRILSILPFDA